MKLQFNQKFILASGSPRRQQLLNDLGISFTVFVSNTEEDFPLNLTKENIPLFLAEKKANSVPENIAQNHTIIAADTIVWLENTVLNKPENKDEALSMLNRLSGKKHTVYTGVAIKKNGFVETFFCATDVTFRTLKNEEILFYFENYQPYDKAGSYGAQDWIGLVGIEKIEGCYFNVMGLPVRDLYLHLQKFE